MYLDQSNAAAIPPEQGGGTREELAYRLRQQQLTAEFGRYALNTHEVSSLLQEATRLCALGLQSKFCKVMEYLPGEKQFLVRAGVGWKPGVVGEARTGADTASPTGYAFSTGAPVISNHLDGDTRFRTPAILREHGIKRAINVLIQSGGTRFGVLEADSATEGRFTEADMEFMQGLANLLGVALDRQRAEQALGEREERHAFLLELSDALRPLSDPMEIVATVSEAVGRHFDVGRCGYLESSSQQDHLVVTRDWTNGTMPSLQGTWPTAMLADECIPQYRSGVPVCFEDAPDPRGGGVRSSVAVQLLKQGNWVASLYVQDTKSHRWTHNDIELMQEIVERTWSELERARAQVALRDSEERFRQFAASSSDVLWIRNAQTLAMEYVSPAVEAIYGVAPDSLLGDVKRWAALVVPDDRNIALEHLEKARSGEAAVHEFRIQRPGDGAFRWIKDTDFALRDEHGNVQRVGGIGHDATEEKLAAEHQSVLLAELQHRVRNIMAVIRSITARTGERAESVTEYASLMAGRLRALARVQALLTRASNVGVSVATIVLDEVSVQAQHEGQYVVDGPDISLSPKAAEVLTLAIHELTTNALKYGALSVPNGKITIRWAAFAKRGAPWLSLNWMEEGAPAQATRNVPLSRGFGTELIEGRVPYELGGRGKVMIGPGGAECHLEFPLKSGTSFLETGAPRKATVFGGALDMSGEADLSGRHIMVIEDDYYLATDVSRALQGAGAHVIGPCPNEAAARAELAEQRPDAVVMDINLGAGASFKLAEHLKDNLIPFVFVTGYDENVIPAEFADVERLEKPVQLRKIVNSISKLI